MTWYATSADSSDKKDESRKIRIETPWTPQLRPVLPCDKKDESRKIRIETACSRQVSGTAAAK